MTARSLFNVTPWNHYWLRSSAIAEHVAVCRGIKHLLDEANPDPANLSRGRTTLPLCKWRSADQIKRKNNHVKLIISARALSLYKFGLRLLALSSLLAESLAENANEPPANCSPAHLQAEQVESITLLAADLEAADRSYKFERNKHCYL